MERLKLAVHPIAVSHLQRSKKVGRKFVNPVPTAVGGTGAIFKALAELLRSREERTPRTTLGPFVTDPRIYETAPENGLRVTWFGHSSLLMEMDGVRLLIDPVWEQRASPVQWFGPKRFFAPTLPLSSLPRLDVVLISHDHYDHLGAYTVRALARMPSLRNVTWVTSLAVGRRLREFGVPPSQIVELDWTESCEVVGAHSSLKITAWPARHFSGRTPFDRFTTLWSSFVLESGHHRVFFGADSGPWAGFAEVAAQYDGFDLTMLEIGAYSPLWGDIHLGPDHAVEMFQSMGGATRAGMLMPIHWGLFNLALHGWRQPMERLEAVAAELGLPLWSPLPGEPTTVAGPSVSKWWKR